eukprot:2576962-Rhodomonas_salina.2
MPGCSKACFRQPGYKGASSLPKVPSHCSNQTRGWRSWACAGPRRKAHTPLQSNLGLCANDG